MLSREVTFKSTECSHEKATNAERVSNITSRGRESTASGHVLQQTVSFGTEKGGGQLNTVQGSKPCKTPQGGVVRDNFAQEGTQPEEELWHPPSLQPIIIEAAENAGMCHITPWWQTGIHSPFYGR
eukprot:5662627-Amphidinium_carterae.1